jgi:hypothetical protein
MDERTLLWVCEIKDTCTREKYIFTYIELYGKKVCIDSIKTPAYCILPFILSHTK